MTTRDYINRKISLKKRGPVNKGFLIGAVFGLTLGIGVAAGMHYYCQNIARSALTSEEQATPSGKGEAAPERLPGSDFRFFSHLPSFEITVPEGQAPPDKAANAAAPSYILQARAFKTREAADEHKRSLSELNYEAKIKKISRDGRDWFRIWLGPYPLTEAASTRRQLRAKGVETMIKEDR